MTDKDIEIEILKTLGDIRGELGEVKSDVRTLVNGAADREHRIRKLEKSKFYVGGFIAAVAAGLTALSDWISNMAHRMF